MIVARVPFIVSIILAIVAATFTVNAQQPSKAKRIVIVSSYSNSADEDRVEAFRKVCEILDTQKVPT